MMSLSHIDPRRPSHRAAMFVCAIGLALMIATPTRAQGVLDQDSYDLQIDLAMGVLDDDPVLNRILTTQPEPWPGPRYDPRSEGIIKRDAERAQDEFRNCSIVINQVGKPVLVCQ